MAVLLEYREDEEREADFYQRKEASSLVLETMASFTNGAILTDI